MIIDCVADLHGSYPVLEGGDLLILGGDYTARESISYWRDFFQWLNRQKYRKKVLIGGNHDNFLTQCIPTQEARRLVGEDADDFEYLCDSGTEFEGLKIWGSPWTKTFEGMNPQCKAFTVNTEKELCEKWKFIPDDIDILVTHSPAYGILDRVKRFNYPKTETTIVNQYENVGSKCLYDWLKYVGRPRLHVFGHIHEGYGQEEVFATYNDKRMISVNCSYMDEHYQPVNKPVRIVL